MIVRMKRLTLLCIASARDSALRRLQEMGVVHVTSLRPPDSRSLETSRSHLAYIKRVLETMPKKTTAKPSGVPADVTVSLVWTMLQEKNDIEEDHADLMQERNRVEPFGNFDPTKIEELREHGVFVKLYVVSPGTAVNAPEDCVFRVIKENKTGVYIAAFSHKEVSLEYKEFRLPEMSLEEMDIQIGEYERRLEECEEHLAVHEGDRDAVAILRDQLEDTVCFLEAREGMGQAAPIAYLRGYIPEEMGSEIMTVAQTEGWGVQIEDPDEDEDVPTLIRNPKWVRPISAVLKGINVLPGYREVDMSAVFLVFFSLFFGILVGDAGYGAIFLGLTLFFRHKHPNAPSEPFALLTITSVATIIWGFLTGNYFGVLLVPTVMQPVTVWLNDMSNMMWLCFLIGATHLTIAHVWNFIRMMPSLQALAQLGWIAMTWLMFFVADTLVLSGQVPGVMIKVAIGGGILIVLFMTPIKKLKNEWFQHVMFPLDIISNFVDVVSYLRLYAVGFAAVAVAQAFNEMALAGGINSILSGFIAALILFLGHGLNIVLAAMGILVHGVRLNTLEFSSHLGVQWAGHQYEPFAHKRETSVTPESGS